MSLPLTHGEVHAIMARFSDASDVDVSAVYTLLELKYMYGTPFDNVFGMLRL